MHSMFLKPEYQERAFAETGTLLYVLSLFLYLLSYPLALLPWDGSMTTKADFSIYFAVLFFILGGTISFFTWKSEVVVICNPIYDIHFFAANPIIHYIDV